MGRRAAPKTDDQEWLDGFFGSTVGRPRLEIPEEIVEEVVQWISEGKTLRDYCRQPGKPSRRTIDGWRKVNESFAARFAHARDIGFDVIAEEALAIADTPQEGVITTEEGEVTKVVTEDMLGHRRLQVDTRLKLLAKWDPRRYGEMQKVALGGDPDAPAVQLSTTERETKLRSILAVAAHRKNGVS